MSGRPVTVHKVVLVVKKMFSAATCREPCRRFCLERGEEERGRIREKDESTGTLLTKCMREVNRSYKSASRLLNPNMICEFPLLFCMGSIQNVKAPSMKSFPDV